MSPWEMPSASNVHDDVIAKHLRWTEKQGHILTGGGMAETYCTAERGYPYDETDLPHHFLQHDETHKAFRRWATEDRGDRGQDSVSLSRSVIAGCWERAVFVGGWQHSTSDDELTHNVQTHNLFVDLRIPRTKRRALLLASSDGTEPTSEDDLNPLQLRVMARQHVFAGYTRFDSVDGVRPVCTRHHCIDWNYVGVGRTRPNKWWVQTNDDGNSWKELSYAADDTKQCYYMERWDRRESGSSSPRLALRKTALHERDGVFVLCGDHFNYVLDRKWPQDRAEGSNDAPSLVDLVDACVESGDLQTARAYLGIDGGHGRVSTRWTIDSAIRPWKEGTKLWTAETVRVVEVDDSSAFRVVWSDEVWEVYDSSFQSAQQLRSFLEDSL